MLHNKLCRCGKSQNCGVIRTHGDQVQLLLYCRYIDLKKGILLKKMRNHSQALKLQQIKTIHYNTSRCTYS